MAAAKSSNFSHYSVLQRECDLKPGLVKFALEAHLRGPQGPRKLAGVLGPDGLGNAEFVRLGHEISSLARAVVRFWRKRDNGVQTDDAGREVPATSLRGDKLAQLLDGAEAAVLHALAGELSVDAEDLRRGAVTLATPLNRGRLTRVVHSKTGYRPSIRVSAA